MGEEQDKLLASPIENVPNGRRCIAEILKMQITESVEVSIFFRNLNGINYLKEGPCLEKIIFFKN